jgi:hypothetical protein
MGYAHNPARTLRITCRGVRPDLWRRLRGQAVYRGLSVGDLLNLIVSEWLLLHAHEHNPTSPQLRIRNPRREHHMPLNPRRGRGPRGQAERAQRSVSYYGRWRRRKSNPSILGLNIPRKILGFDGRLVLGGALAAAGYALFTRSGAQLPTMGSAPKPHSRAQLNAQTGMLYQSSRPNTPPNGAQGTGEWVAVNCPDHGSPGVCWQWEPLSDISLAGIPFTQ